MGWSVVATVNKETVVRSQSATFMRQRRYSPNHMEDGSSLDESCVDDSFKAELFIGGGESTSTGEEATTFLSDLESIPPSSSHAEDVDDDQSYRCSSKHSSSGRSALLEKQNRLIKKLKLDIVILTESLRQARASDIEILTSQLDDMRLDLSRVSQRNAELRDKLRLMTEQRKNSLSSTTTNSSQAADDPSSSATDQVKANSAIKGEKERVVHEVRFREDVINKQKEEEDSRKEKILHTPSVYRRRRIPQSSPLDPNLLSYDLILKALPKEQKDILVASIKDMVESARESDKRVIFELSNQLRQLASPASLYPGDDKSVSKPDIEEPRIFPDITTSSSCVEETTNNTHPPPAQVETSCLGQSIHLFLGGLFAGLILTVIALVVLRSLSPSIYSPEL